jgi:hypothetical protein
MNGKMAGDSYLTFAMGVRILGERRWPLMPTIPAGRPCFLSQEALSFHVEGLDKFREL